MKSESRLTKVVKFINKPVFKIIFAAAVLIPLILIFSSVVNYFSTTPQIIYTYPLTEQKWDDYTKPIEIQFNVPVVISKLEPKLTPRIEGEWVWDRYFGLNDLTTTGRFYPKETLYPDTRVVVYIIGVSRLYKEESHELSLTLNTDGEAEIASTIPENKAENFQKDNSISIKLTKNNNFNSDFTFTFEPAVEIEPPNIFEETIILKPKNSLSQDTQYKLKIERRPIRYNFAESKILEFNKVNYSKTITFNTTKEPLIEKFEPQGNGVKETDQIKVQFMIPMQQDSVEKSFSIEPKVNGIFEWLDNKNFIFKSEKLSKDTKYKVTFAKGIKSIVEGMTEKDLVFEFKTLGPVTMTSINPSDNSWGIAETTSISIAFDQEVDKESAQSKFSISPNPGGTFGWEGNTMIFYPANRLNFVTTYTINLDSGVKSLYGLDSNSAYSSKFTVRSNEVLIGGIPQIYQPYGSFSCNIYAALMLLAWKGHSSSASAIISEIGYNENQYEGQWTGNPYVEYVGNSDGSWGYGVYWNPIKNIFSNRGIQSEIVQGWSLQGMAYKLLEGHPIIIWRYNGESANYDKDWIAGDGTYVRAINGQHGSVVIGFRGSPDNPTQFLLNDPWYGQLWFDASYLDYVWSRMNRTALIVY